MSNMTAEQITPFKAAEWLHKSREDGRPFDLGKVARFAHEMKTGKWKLSKASCICFDKAGYLVDGHQRLHAVLVAKVMIASVIVRDVAVWADITDFSCTESVSR